MSARAKLWTALASVVLLAASAARATEGGGGTYQNGIENYMWGAAPPPGFHFLAYGLFYRATTVRDNDGNDVTPPDFKAQAFALALRPIWMTPVTVLGGNLGFHAIVPLVDLGVSVPGKSQNKFGVGDITFGPALGFHLSPNLHFLVAVDVNAPTGGYSTTDLANIGRNYWNFEPLTGFTYLQADGINADLKLMYDFNLRNGATQYLSGQELHADYALGWGVGGTWVFGVGGFLYQQVTNDDDNGTTVPNSKGRAFAVGPSVKFDSGRHWFVTAKYEFEMAVANRIQGGGLDIKAIIPISF